MKVILKFKDGNVVQSSDDTRNIDTPDALLQMIVQARKQNILIPINNEYVREYNDLYSAEILFGD